MRSPDWQIITAPQSDLVISFVPPARETLVRQCVANFEFCKNDEECLSDEQAAQVQEGYS